MKILLILFTAGCAALAQNSDIGLLVGGTIPNTQAKIAGTTIIGSQTGGVSYQFSYAWQIHGWRAGDLHLEIPVAGFAGPSSGTIVPNRVTGSIGGAIFITPGVRYMVHTSSHISFYAAAGVGPNWSTTQTSVVGQAISSTETTTLHPVFGIGGGIDFRLSRVLSLRGEIRDFVSTGALGGTMSRNHTLFQFGIGLHF